MNDRNYYDLTVEDVEGRLRESLTEALENWAPNHVIDGRVSSYDDWIDRLEGEFQMPDGTLVTLDLGNGYDTPQYKALKRLARKVRDEVS